MKITEQIAKQFRGVYFGGNWTAVNFKDTLHGLDWNEATTKIDTLNSIATLMFHTNYYVSEVLKFLKGELFIAHDNYSFDAPPIRSSEDWQALVDKSFRDAEAFSETIREFPEEKLWEVFFDEKYGNYYRNLHGIIEHNHYHLGQIVLIKKLLRERAEQPMEP